MRAAALSCLLAWGCQEGPTAAPDAGASAAPSASTPAPSASVQTGGVHTCDAISIDSRCMEFNGPGHTEDSAKELCHDAVTKGRYSREGCPTADRLGTCTMFAGKPREFRTHHYKTGGMPLGPDAGAATCHGAWTAAP